MPSSNQYHLNYKIQVESVMLCYPMIWKTLFSLSFNGNLMKWRNNLSLIIVYPGYTLELERGVQECQIKSMIVKGKVNYSDLVCAYDKRASKYYTTFQI